MASTTSTTTATSPTTASVETPASNDSATLLSRLRNFDFDAWIEERRAIAKERKSQTPPPIHQKHDKLPVLHNWSLMRWVLLTASWPLVVHELYVWAFGRNLNIVFAFALYTTAFLVNAGRELRILEGLGAAYGFLDGDKHARDELPPDRVKSTVTALLTTATFRPLMVVMLSYRPSQSPLTIDWVALGIELCLYGVVLDFWFYWYHRIMHEHDGLWQFHKTHHLTKHPSPIHTLFADHEQEVMDIAGVPLLTYITLKLMGLPMGFYEWWYCHQLIVFAELIGHSGLRVHVSAPSPIHSLLCLLDMELVVEDHDLHHRTGWKTSHNYGKQTRVVSPTISRTLPLYLSADLACSGTASSALARSASRAPKGILIVRHLCACRSFDALRT